MEARLLQSRLRKGKAYGNTSMINEQQGLQNEQYWSFFQGIY